MLCIRQTLNGGRVYGFASGLGAATADALYGAVAALGITTITTILIEQADWLRAAGGLFLLYLGLRTLLSAPPPQTTPASAPAARGLLRAAATTFALTLANPMTIFAFMGIFAGLGGSIVSDAPGASLLMVGGVFTGSAAWWLFLALGIGWLRTRFKPAWLLAIHRLSGAIILAFALFILSEIGR